MQPPRPSAPRTAILRVLTTVFAVAALGAPTAASAASAAELAARSDAALARLIETAPEAERLLDDAAGVLIFPRVIKVGVGVGGEYGEGVLRIDGETVDHFSTASASIGFQLGAQAKAQFLLFLTPEALRRFRRADGWEVGVDGSVTLIRVGAGASVDSTNVSDPVVAFVLADRGLMYDLSLAGTKISRIQRD